MESKTKHESTLGESVEPIEPVESKDDCEECEECEEYEDSIYFPSTNILIFPSRRSIKLECLSLLNMFCHTLKKLHITIHPMIEEGARYGRFRLTTNHEYDHITTPPRYVLDYVTGFINAMHDKLQESIDKTLLTDLIKSRDSRVWNVLGETIYFRILPIHKHWQDFSSRHTKILWHYLDLVVERVQSYKYMKLHDIR